MANDPVDEGCYVLGKKREPAREEPDPVSIPVIPIIFIPGIMGSNLRVKPSAIAEVKRRFEEAGRGGEYTEKAWSPPSLRYSKFKMVGSLLQETVGANCRAVRVAKVWEGYGPKLRQVLLNPKTVEVDDQGFLPRFVPGLGEMDGQPAMAVARERGWGTVHWDGYWKLLKFLEHNLNGQPPFDQSNIQTRRWRLETLIGSGGHYGFNPGVIPTEAEVEKAVGNRFPVHAMGYNWTQSNLHSAEDILDKIKKCIQGYRARGYSCEQVILVTHSMGGLVARVASQLDSGGRILGVVHGVMPATGAPDAYRNMVAGVEHEILWVFEDLRSAFASIAGKTAAETTAVMANAPGALELLPSHLYPPGWLKVERDMDDGRAELVFALPEKDRNDPYTYIYKEKEAWWRLVDPKLLDPAEIAFGGKANKTDVAWKLYCDRISDICRFHMKYLNNEKYHKRSFPFFGKHQKTYADVRWRLSQGSIDLSKEEIYRAHLFTGDGEGVNQLMVTKVDAMTGKCVDGVHHFAAVRRMTASLRKPDGDGDGTVPVASGNAPAGTLPNTQALHGFNHAGAYKCLQTQIFTMMAICKLAGLPELQ